MVEATFKIVINLRNRVDSPAGRTSHTNDAIQPLVDAHNWLILPYCKKV
jgi:hypothetical protein